MTHSLLPAFVRGRPTRSGRAQAAQAFARSHAQRARRLRARAWRGRRLERPSTPLSCPSPRASLETPTYSLRVSPAACTSTGTMTWDVERQRGTTTWNDNVERQRGTTTERQRGTTTWNDNVERGTSTATNNAHDHDRASSSYL